MMNYNEYIQRAYETAKSHGFHDKPLTIAHMLMLTVTEVAEMVEADRKSKRAQVAMFKRESVSPQPKERKQHWKFCFETFIKDTMEDEMADTCIRLFDLAGAMGWKLDALDIGRLLPEDLKRFSDASVTEKAYELCRLLTEHNPSEITAELALAFLTCWAKADGIDLEWHISQKMEYNSARGRLHGKKY